MNNNDNGNAPTETVVKPKRRGGFPPGKSGNPGGRPKLPEEFKELAKKHSLDALKVVIDISENPEAKDSDRIKASELIIDRGFGRPLQANQIGIEGGPQTLEVVFADPDLEKWSK